MEQTAIRSPRYDLLDQVPLGVCVLSPAFTVRFWNTCLESWTGIPRREILGTDISQRFAHLREPRYLQRLQMIFDGGPPTVFSSQLHRHLIPAPLPDGELRIQHTVVTAIEARDGYDALLSIQDVTDLTRRLEDHRALHHQAIEEARQRQRAQEERRRLETKIQHAQKLESLGVLAGGIAHDFNNLLVGILGNADLALAKEPSFSPRRKYLESIVAASQRAADLSNQMLAFSGKGKFVTQVLDLGELVPEVIHLLGVSLPKQARIRDELPPFPLGIEADPTQIRQLLMNLISNAADAVAEEDGVITLSGGRIECDEEYLSGSYLMEDLAVGTYVYIDVTDDGPGMSRETVEKIFDPFFTTKFAGRGLGLAAVLGIVRGHRGCVKVSSEPGRGTTFRVLLPATEQPAAVAADAGLEVGIELAGTETVLVIDDEEPVRTVAQRILEDAGFTVITAEDGDQGVEIFEREADRVALVLLDMTMPRLSGDKTLRELRGVRQDVTVVLSSGYSEQVVKEQFEGQRPAGFLQKPYGPADLLQKVKGVLGQEATRSHPKTTGAAT
ncbi:MAG: response regulator [bacterium]|nr:response regulator [bacterium]